YWIKKSVPEDCINQIISAIFDQNREMILTLPISEPDDPHLKIYNQVKDFCEGANIGTDQTIRELTDEIARVRNGKKLMVAIPKELCTIISNVDSIKQLIIRLLKE